MQASEERLRAIFSQSAAGIVQTDLRGHLLLVNNLFCEILGYSESELLSMRMRDICVAGDITEADRLFETMAERGRSFEMESRLLRKDGALVWVASSVRRFATEMAVSSKRPLSLSTLPNASAQDVERRLAAIIASSNDAILASTLVCKSRVGTLAPNGSTDIRLTRPIRPGLGS